MSLLNHREMEVLTAVMSKPGQRNTDIARACNLSAEITNKTLIQLQSKGYINSKLKDVLEWYFVGQASGQIVESVPLSDEC